MDDEPKHLRRLERIYARSPVYLVTTVLHTRVPLLNDPAFHSICNEVWNTSREIHRWSVGSYVIMPDHVHFVCRESAEGAASLSTFVGKWKEWTSKFAHRRLGFPLPLWQREFFDHVIRSDESLREKIDYLLYNPVRSGHVEDPIDWPYRGNHAEWVIL